MSKIRKVIGGLFSLSLVAAMVLAVLYRQAIYDQWKFWQYQPTSEILALAERSGMSDSGKFHFFVTHPRLESSSEFNSECRRAEKGSPILGCYKQGEDTIHIYNVSDPELDGIKEVTAAHEMLHAVYARLGDAERQKLDNLLESAYSQVKTDKLAERMAYYDRAQPGSRANELHSILGTEFRDLGPELEAHYAKYFSNRSKVLDLHDNYSQKFAAIESQAAELQTSLTNQKAEIERRSSAYESAMSSLNQRIAQFNKRANAGDFSSQAEFQAERSRLQAESNSLASERNAIMALIENYNSDVEKLNALGEQAERLNQSLDSLGGVDG